jgi:acyl transferase domain-containing protein
MTPDELDLRIGIIGMAGRFPGADGVDALWRNLRAGIESISVLSREDVEAAGVPAAVAAAPGFVPAIGRIADPELWDAAFFGYSPAEAAQLDPQHRLFLECAWQALEDAGYPAGAGLPAGVWAGAGFNTYLWSDAAQAVRMLVGDGAAGLIHGNDKDFLASRVAYKLDLRGPAITIQTACSTSLVAVHAACQAILAGECDLALAGGVSIRFPQVGHIFQDGSIFSPDGHCRAFDAGARGVVGGNGAGVVVLKRLSAALADGDAVRAVVLGSAVNNDGRGKLGYTAPSVDGQVEVIRGAHAAAGVDPASISYVEAHGTATALGDSVELAALAHALGPRPAPCRIGSLKTNIGHLDTAAGVAGLIKTVLALEHRELPASLHFRQAAPGAIDAARIEVNTALAPWPSPAGQPRRAGVSSFGIGGTNAHVVLEEAPPRSPGSPSRALQVLRLSAATPPALDAACARLADRLEAGPPVELADVAHTFATGRARHRFRRAVVCAGAAEAAALLRGGPAADRCDAAPETTGRVVLLLPGQGTQAVGMGAGLYAGEPVFRAAVDECAALLRPRLSGDVRSWLFDGPPAGRSLDDTALAQPALFTVEYALGRLWLSLGLRPAALIGHSLGEIVAACLAGVFGLPDALTLVAERGRLMQAMPPGAMLAAALPEDEVEALLPPDATVAAVNAPGTCTVAGPRRAIDALAERLAARGVAARRLRTSHAFHSAMMDPVLEPLERCVAGLARHPAALPVLSNVTGRPLSEAEATSPAYWARHARAPVRFSAGVAAALADGPAIFLEVGPGQSLGQLVRRQPGDRRDAIAVASLGDGAAHEPRTLARAIAALWAHGAEIDLAAYHAGERRIRVALPSYPFERQRYTLTRGPAVVAAPASPIQRARWTQRAVGRCPDPPSVALRPDTLGVAAPLHERLERAGCRIIVLPAGDAEALAALRASRGVTDVVDLAGLAAATSCDELTAALAAANAAGPSCRLHVATHSALAVTAGEPRSAPRAALAGALGGRQLAPAPFRVIDLGARRSAGWPRWAADALASELLGGVEPLVARRGAERWVLEPAALDASDAAPPDREAAVILVEALPTAALTFAFALARRGQALIVVEDRDTIDAMAQQRWRLQEAAQLAGGRIRVVAADPGRGGALAAAAQLLERAREPVAGLCLGLGPGVLRGAGAPGALPALIRASLAVDPGFHAVWWPDAIGAAERGRIVDWIAAAEDELEIVVAHIDVGGDELDAAACEALLGALASGRGGWLIRPSAAPLPAPSTVGAWSQARSRPALARAYVAPRTDSEKRIAELWQELLGIAELGADDDFFDVGGHSLMATQLTARLSAAFDVPLSLDEVIQANTIAGQARLVEHAVLRQLLGADAAGAAPP